MTDWHQTSYFTSYFTSLKLYGSKMEKVNVGLCGWGIAGDTGLEDGLSKDFFEIMFRNVFIDADSFNTGNRQIHSTRSDLVTKWMKEVPFEKEEGEESEAGGSGGGGREGGGQREKAEEGLEVEEESILITINVRASESLLWISKVGDELLLFWGSI